MLSVPMYNPEGSRVGEMEIDPAVLGLRVRPRLLKQAVVAYRDHQRQDSARTKGRSDVEGSTRKIYRQKGTGNARAGSIRTPVRRGGGRTFAKRGPRAYKAFPKKMRRLARNNAMLAKIQSGQALIVEGFDLSAPKTKAFAAVLSKLGVDRGCVFAVHAHDRNVLLSGRNIPGADVRVVTDVNAYDILRRDKLVFTRPAFERIVGDPVAYREVSTD